MKIHQLKSFTMKYFSLLSLTFILSCNSANKMSSNREHFPTFDAEAHRGGRGLMPENTIPAMKHAIDLGVSTLEMDVHITRDNKVVVSHDPYFNADITTTPEGNTLSKAEAVKRVLYEMDYDSIVKYDVGIKPHPAFPGQKKVAAHKPLLSELLRETENYAKENGSRKLWYNIETKSNPKTEGTNHPDPETFVKLLMNVVQEAGVAERTVIQSFDLRTLRVLHQHYPGIKTALLISQNNKNSIDEQLQDLGFVPFIYSPNYHLVTPELVKTSHEKGMKVVPWTPNTEQEIQDLRDMGVDGIITDYPDLF